MSFLHRLFKGRHGPAAGVAVPKLSAKVAKPGSDGRPYPALTTLIAEFVESDEPAKTLVLGDSVMERIAREDEDRRTLGDMIADEFASRRTAIICAACNNPLVYRWLLAVLQAMPNQPKSIILPINMRAFSPQWHLNPDWQMTQELTLLREYLLRKPQVFSAIDDVYRNSRAHADIAEM